jgi:hypothetical protein
VVLDRLRCHRLMCSESRESQDYTQTA